MNIQAFLYVTTAMQVYFPCIAHQTTLLTVEPWYRMICDIQLTTAMVALQQYANCNPSTIAVIRKPIVALDTPPATWEESWTNVLRAMHSYGIDRAYDALDTLDPLTRMCVAFIGYEELCLSSRISDTKAYYARVFRLFKKRADLSALPYIPATDADRQSSFYSRSKDVFYERTHHTLQWSSL